MAQKQLNPWSAWDPWLAIPFFLAVSGFLGRLIRPLFPANWGAIAGKVPVHPLLAAFVGPRHSSHPDDVGLLGLAAAAVLLAILFVLRDHAEKNNTCRVLAGATMALAGAVPVFGISFILWLIVLGLPGLLGFHLPGFLPDWASFSVLILPPSFLASYWAGWRYGAWGPFWGVCAALLWLSLLVAGTAKDAGVGVGNLEMAPAAVLLGALAGALGAARFQRSLTRNKRAAGAAPPV